MAFRRPARDPAQRKAVREYALREFADLRGDSYGQKLAKVVREVIEDRVHRIANGII